MLRKDDIVRILNGLNLPKSEYWIVMGTALVMHGVKEETKDIDLGCTTKLFEQLMIKGREVSLTRHNRRTLSINEYVEVFENWNVDNIEIVERLPVASLESIKKLKYEVGGEKDLKDINMIDEFINRTPYTT